MTDAINIKTPWIVHIGIAIEIITRPDQNSNEVLLKVVDKAISLFDPDKMQINQPIIISNITSELDKIEGVQSIYSMKFINLVNQNEGYSGNVYDVQNAMRGGIIYPSIDPMIFSVRYPKRDIKVRVIDL